jgi:hypothetical protein
VGNGDRKEEPADKVKKKKKKLDNPSCEERKVQCGRDSLAEENEG